MDDLFKDIFDASPCKSIGVCSTNPVLYALEAVIINEIRQIAFYTVRLKEFNLINTNIMKEAVFFLSVKISDTSFSKKYFLEFFSEIRKLKNEVENFYIKKCREMNVSYEFITPVFADTNEKFDITGLIKSGENIIKHIFNNLKAERIRLIDLIVLTTKITSSYLVELSEFEENLSNDYFEVLRLLSLTNAPAGAREEKLIRRIKEFSSFSRTVLENLFTKRSEKYGKRQSFKISRDIEKGKSILITGGDLDELYNLLEAVKDKNINVYTNSSMVLAYTYPKFTEFKNFKGVFGTNDIEFDFSNFDGVVYITRNSDNDLDNALRGKIYTTKAIPADKLTKLDVDNLAPLIEAAEKEEGFAENKKGNPPVFFEFDLENIRKIIEETGEKPLFIYEGGFNKNLKEKDAVNFQYPYEGEGLYFVLNNSASEDISVYFSKCTLETIKIILTLLDKKIKIFLPECSSVNISPHITEALKKDFHIKTAAP